MISINEFIKLFPGHFKAQKDWFPWQVTQHLGNILTGLMEQLDTSFEIVEGIALHKTARVEKGAILKAPLIIGEDCFIGSNSCLRGGVYLGNSVRIGMGCEIKASIIFNGSAIAHFNFIGDSIIGSYVNFEAGSITANHYNERDDKEILVIHNLTIISTGIDKFGALVGDYSKIGANAVLSPGTLLPPQSIVKRLQLVDQVSQKNNS
ncbi:MAG: LpxA family transferase [Ferruginibacter sp.]|nr:LpxA family transferase [Ferruginibacter sp.]